MFCLFSTPHSFRPVLPSSGAQVRQELQGRVEELKSYPELLSAAEQSLFECQANLQRSERMCSEKSESIRQLQVKVCNVSCVCHRMWSAVKVLHLTTRWYYSPICLSCCEFVLIFVIERASDSVKSVWVQPSLPEQPFVSVLCCVSLKTAHFVFAQLWQTVWNGQLLEPFFACDVKPSSAPFIWCWSLYFTYRWRARQNCWDHLWTWKSPFMRPIYTYKRTWILSTREPLGHVSSPDVTFVCLCRYRVEIIYCASVCVCRQMDKLQQENEELIRRLAAQEEALSYSNQQLDQRSSECQALSRQLEAALSDVRQQVPLPSVPLFSVLAALNKSWLFWKLMSHTPSGNYIFSTGPGQQGKGPGCFQRRGPSDQNPGAGSREEPKGQRAAASQTEQAHGKRFLWPVKGKQDVQIGLNSSWMWV